MLLPTQMFTKNKIFTRNPWWLFFCWFGSINVTFSHFFRTSKMMQTIHFSWTCWRVAHFTIRAGGRIFVVRWPQHLTIYTWFFHLVNHQTMSMSLCIGSHRTRKQKRRSWQWKPAWFTWKKMALTAHSSGNTSYPAFALSWVCLTWATRQGIKFGKQTHRYKPVPSGTGVGLQPCALLQGSCVCYGKFPLTGQQFVARTGLRSNWFPSGYPVEIQVFVAPFLYSSFVLACKYFVQITCLHVCECGECVCVWPWRCDKLQKVTPNNKRSVARIDSCLVVHPT